MSLEKTKDELVQALSDNDNKVIALSGKWGIGKTYLWEQVKHSSNDPKVQNALYASLFGVSSIDQIKLKLIQSAAKSPEDYPTLFKSIKQGCRTAVKALEGFHKVFAALNDIGLLVAPVMLRDRILVLDDIERKNDKLGIDEVLGFIDEFTRQHGSRVVLILNDDQIDKREIWNVLREKVIDQELRLTTSAAEAFEIGSGFVNSQWAVQIQSAIEVCGVTNIRIIRKVIKAVDRILGDRQGLSAAVLSRVIPSTVLLASTHYKGIEDGPDFEFILSIEAERNAPYARTLNAYLGGKETGEEKEETQEEKRKSRWKELLDRLRIYRCDEYERLVIEFLQSGLLSVEKLTAVIDRYVEEAGVMEERCRCQEAQQQCCEFLGRVFWAPDRLVTDEQLLKEAEAIVEKSALLDCYKVTSLHDALVTIPGGETLVGKTIDLWVDAFKEKDLQEIDFRTFPYQPVHPRILEKVTALKTKAEIDTSACKDGFWKNQRAMQTASIDDFESAIRQAALVPDDFQKFIYDMLELCADKAANVSHFGSAMDNFTAACRRIAQDADSPRLARIVKRLFADKKLSGLLDMPVLECLTDADGPDEGAGDGDE